MSMFLNFILPSDFEYGGGLVLKETELRLVASSIPPENPQVYICIKLYYYIILFSVLQIVVL